MSRGISGGGEQVIKFANTSNRSRVCLSSQNDNTIIILNSQNVQFKFRQVSRHYCLL